MDTVLLVIHLIIVVSLVLVILLQKSSTDSLSGLGGGAANPSALTNIRGSANILTRVTSFLAFGFICTSLGLAYLANQSGKSELLDNLNAPAAQVAPAVTAKPAEPAVPIAE